ASFVALESFSSSGQSVFLSLEFYLSRVNATEPAVEAETRRRPSADYLRATEIDGPFRIAQQ
uniref:hypothetical protein n=1 Tax=Paraburkholderia dilworthii TaxID=948106 RepID=UPI0004899B60